MTQLVPDAVTIQNLSAGRTTTFNSGPSLLTPLNSAKNYEPFIIMLEKAGTKTGSKVSPALMLLVSPKSFDRKLEKVFNESWTAGGIVVELSGEQPDRLNFQGTIGGYYTEQTGLTRLYRRFSASYQNLMNLLHYFKNNGYTYEADPALSDKRSLSPFIKSATERKSIRSIGNVIIWYRREIFLGSMESFSITDSADKPYNLDYTFDFIVRQYINRDLQSTNGVPKVEGHTTNEPGSLDYATVFSVLGRTLNLFGI
jgi:hypothetical protein